MSSTDTPESRRVRRPSGRLILVLVPFVCLALLLTVNFVVTQTDVVTRVVDFVRDLPFVGPDRIAALEDTFYNAQDAWSKFVYERTHPPVVVAQADPAAPTPTPSPTPQAVSPDQTPPATLEPGAQSTPPAPTVTGRPRVPSAIPPLILSDPQPGEGIWSLDGLPLPDVADPPLWRTFYRPDPERPFARVDIVWIDLSQTNLSLVAGTVEPRAIDKIRGSGKIPDSVQSGGKLLAAWNGGFLTMHGAYGMMINRRVLLPARDGFATLAQYVDGSWKMGIWGQDIKLTPDLVNFRENGPILVENGAVNQNANLAWGKSVAGDTRIWRSGIGFTADGGLLYAAGNALSAQTLGEALRRAGAVTAMQLDVNAGHVFFFTYETVNGVLTPVKLNAAIPGPSRVFLTPYDRDFMYLTFK